MQAISQHTQFFFLFPVYLLFYSSQGQDFKLKSSCLSLGGIQAQQSPTKAESSRLLFLASDPGRWASITDLWANRYSHLGPGTWSKGCKATGTLWNWLPWPLLLQQRKIYSCREAGEATGHSVFIQKHSNSCGYIWGVPSSPLWFLSISCVNSMSYPVVLQCFLLSFVWTVLISVACNQWPWLGHSPV